LRWHGAAFLSATAIADTSRKIDVPAGELTIALQELAKQSGVDFTIAAKTAISAMTSYDRFRSRYNLTKQTGSSP
jgi:hypothetical protein